jgi:hypothetical protein
MDIDFALLADHAEVINGKLYLMGGGWDLRHAPEVPAKAQFVVALGIRVEWEETNVPIELRLVLEDDDGAALLTIDGRMQVGRPPHIPAGSTQLAQSMVLVQADLSHFGGYRVVVRAKGPDGEELVKTLPFGLVRHGPGALPPPPAG